MSAVPIPALAAPPVAGLPARRAAAPRAPRASRLVPLALVLALLMLLLVARPAQARTVLLTQATAVAADTPRFPETGPATAVSLPDLWERSHPGHAGAVWYRLRFDVPLADADGRPYPSSDDGALLAAYVERVCSNLEAWVNGHLVHRGGRMTDPVTRNCYRPQTFMLPAGLLRPGTNTLDIKVAGHALERVSSRQRAGALSAVEIGPADEMAALRTREQFWHHIAPQVTAGMLLLLGSFALVLGWRNQRDRHLRYFGALCVAWAAMSARLWLTDVPLPNEAVELLVSSTVPLVTLCGVQFLLRYAGWWHRGVDAVLLAQCALLPASLAMAGPQHLFTMASAWYWLLGLESLVAMAWYLWLSWRVRRADFWPMSALLGLVAVLALAELAAQQDRLGGMHQHYLPFGVPLVFALIGARLLWQHARALQVAELGQMSLESRIREATAEMERSYKQMAELRVEQVTQQERKRIAADLHDDLGAKLLTIVHTSDNDRISTLAREALEEMRLSVRGLTGKPVRLADALGDWRAEIVARLSQAGVESEWRAPGEEELPQRLAARAYVQTTRILREAVSNVIKHSGASFCSVRSQVVEGDFQLVIQDNGRGIPMELDGRLDRGHGMSSMKHRAKQLHGQCLVESGPGYGTVIRLTIPLERHALPA